MDNLNFFHGGNIYEVKRIFKRDIIDFSSNINFLELPLNIKKSINFKDIQNYPDIEARDLKRKIGEYWKIKIENILVGNGSVELLYLIINAFKPKSVEIVIPTFSEYERACRDIKKTFVRRYEKEDFKLNLSRISDSCILFLSNPNNPTGNLFSLDYQKLEELPNKLIVVDEAFMDFLPYEEKYTLILNAKNSKKIIVLRSFTKFFALAGLRVGYSVAHKDNIELLNEYKIPWNVNTFALKAAEYILNDKEYINRTKKIIEEERNFLFNEISKIRDFKPYPSVTNFLLVKIKNKNLNSKILLKELIFKGILIRDCSNFRGLNDRFIRIAVRSHRENLKLIKTLKEMA